MLHMTSSNPLLDSDTDPPVHDLVGWAINGRDAEPPVADEVGREVLATALGLRPETLGALSPEAVQTALRRLRGLIQQLSRLAAEAAIDDLTGAMRRGAGLDAMRREIARNQRVSGKGIAVVFIDVDGLKTVNDTEGHAAGDTLLRQVVESIRERLRAYDIVIRWGGDEFVCVLSNTSEDEARRTVADIEAHVRAHTGGRTVSTGLATVTGDESAEALVAVADAALYEGRTRVRSA
jgi:diguanylate cyclase (GGDEF)-like protein